MLAIAHADKPLLWLHGEVKTPPFSAEARIEAGMLLRRLQRGERGHDSDDGHCRVSHEITALRRRGEGVT